MVDSSPFVCFARDSIPGALNYWVGNLSNFGHNNHTPFDLFFRLSLHISPYFLHADQGRPGKSELQLRRGPKL